MPVRALWAALRRWLSPHHGSVPAPPPPPLSSPPPSEPKPKQPQLRYAELLALIASDTALLPEQVRQVCDRLLQQFAELIEQDQGFTSPVLSFKEITRPDQRRFARVVRRLPPPGYHAIGLDHPGGTPCRRCRLHRWLDAPELVALVAAGLLIATRLLSPAVALAGFSGFGSPANRRHC